MFHVEHDDNQQSAEGTPLVSIFIRARNEAEEIGECLRMVFAQEVSFSYEVVVLDCESEDGTADIAKQFDVRLYSIPPKLFTYSSALNLGLELCHGKYFAPLSAHATPAHKEWLKFHVEHMESSPEVVASYSRQIGRGDESAPEDSSRQKSFPSSSMTYGLSEARRLIATGVEPYHAFPFSNAASVIRREVALKASFREIPFSEDRAFALDAVSGDDRKAEVSYVAEAKVYHSHAPNFFVFYQEARKATISRGLINRLYRDKIESGHAVEIPESKIVLYLKLAPLAVFTALKALLNVPRGTFARLASKEDELKRCQRESKFYLASFGTTLGKIRGIWEYQRVKQYSCPVAQTEKLKSSLSNLK